MPEIFRRGLERYLTAEQLDKLRHTSIGIAGAGGLGSNAAMLLARSGIERMVLIDHDTVEPSNLNRQHYWPDQAGVPKVHALAGHLLALNECMHLRLMQTRLTAENMPEVIDSADIWVEALDNAQIKKSFVEVALRLGHKVVCASGIAGYGGTPMEIRRLDNLIAVGDFTSSTDNLPPLAPRVMQAAAMMADCVLQLILKN